MIYYVVGFALFLVFIVLLALPFLGVPVAIPAVIIMIIVIALWAMLLSFPLADAIEAIASYETAADVAQTAPVIQSPPHVASTPQSASPAESPSSGDVDYSEPRTPPSPTTLGRPPDPCPYDPTPGAVLGRVYSSPIPAV